MGFIKTLLEFLSKLLGFFSDSWGPRAKWEREYERLGKACMAAKEHHKKMVVAGDSLLTGVAYDQWLSAAKALGNHRRLGIQRGYIP